MFFNYYFIFCINCKIFIYFLLIIFLNLKYLKYKGVDYLIFIHIIYRENKLHEKINVKFIAMLFLGGLNSK